ncbi:MAG TPA: carboxypeptidase regulatory-like domain-containing protein, partial [Gemmatimonadaceae bacterium]|nr:carboxypeptidase regulatory-like domain-containing protein [Gemmatimonadaceae bacterium]
MRALTLFSLLLAPGVAALAHAQQAPAAGATANAIGVAFDSIRMRPLAGARVRVDTSELFGTTDASGRFHIEGIPPGSHVLRVQHPLIDTLGVALRSDAETFAAGQTKALELATPSPEILVSILCSAAWRNRGPAALMGRVYEADSGRPAAGAKVSFVWYELDITSNVRRAPRVREAVVGADGTYRICGLPAELEGRAQVIKGGLTSGDIPLNFGQDILMLRSMSIALPGAVAAAPGTGPDSAAPRAAPLGSARLSGRVVTKAGQPLAGARVQIDGTSRVATTRPTGEFVLDSLPSGTQTVSARLLGYAPVEQAVDLSSSEASSVTLSMDVFVPVLETVRVSAQRE